MLTCVLKRAEIYGDYAYQKLMQIDGNEYLDDMTPLVLLCQQWDRTHEPDSLE